MPLAKSIFARPSGQQQMFRQIAARQSRQHQEHINVKACQLAAQRFGEAAQGVFAGRVFRPGRHRSAAAHRGDVHHSRLTPPLQHGNGRAHQFGRREEVDLHDLPQNRFRGIREMRPTGHAGIVDEDVEPTQPLFHLREQARPIVVAGDVGGNARRLQRRVAPTMPRLPAAYPPIGPPAPGRLPHAASCSAQAHGRCRRKRRL